MNTASSASVVAMTARPISRVPSIAAWNGDMPLLFDEAVDVLEHDDRVVDDDADHQRQREHRHLVEREARAPAMTREGADDRRRDGDGGDERRAEVAQEDEDDDRGEDAAENEVFLDGGERRLDELRVVADEPDLDVRRQRLLNLRHPRLDRVGKRHRVDAALLPDGDRQRRLADRASRPTSDPRRVSTTRPMSRMRIGELPRVATTRSLKASGVRSRPTVRTDSSRSPCSSRPPGSSRFCDAQRRGDVGGREAVGVQPIGIDLDLDLAAPRAEEQHLADAVDRLEPLLDVLLEERRQLDRPASAPRPRT